MTTMHLIAAVIGYIVTGLLAAYLFVIVWAWLWWPFATLVAELRMYFADPDSGGWRNLKWWVIPRAYVRLLREYPANFFAYGEGTTTWHGIGVWHHPTHPFSLGRIKWFKP